MIRAKYEKEEEGKSEIAAPKEKRIKSDFAKERSLRPTMYKVSSTERRCVVDPEAGEADKKEWRKERSLQKKGKRFGGEVRAT